MEQLTINQDRCKGCGLCVSVCPKKILELNQDKLNPKGYHPVFLTNREKCIRCAFCATICPDSVFELSEQSGCEPVPADKLIVDNEPVAVQEVDADKDPAQPKLVAPTVRKHRKEQSK